MLPGIGQPAYQFLPPNMLGYDGQLGRELAFDPARARALLIAAGYASGKDVPLIYWQYEQNETCLLYTSPSPRDRTRSRMPSSA